MVGAAALAFIVASSAIGHVFGKYIDLKRYKPQKDLEAANAIIHTMEGQIKSLESANETLRKRIEAMEARVSSEVWDLEQTSRTIGKQGSGTS